MVTNYDSTTTALITTQLWFHEDVRENYSLKTM